MFTKKYTSRNSPPYPANECRGLIKLGNDGKEWASVSTSSGIYRWTAQKADQQSRSSQKKYNIHDNGGVPFQVMISGNSVTVLRKRDDKSLFTVTADKIFIGKTSPDDPYQNGSADAGNSILLQMGDTYRYIGSEIYDFKSVPGDTIVKYYSNVGNSDVPYPYAVGLKYFYFMLEKVAIEKSFFDLKGDIYRQSYYAHSIKMCLYGNPRTDICKDKSVYEQKLKDLKQKTVHFKVKVVEKRLF